MSLILVLDKTLKSPLDCKKIQPIHPKGGQSLVFIGRTECWSWNSNTLATSCEELTHWKRPWCWEGLGAGGEGDDRGWDGWMASPTRWTWVWVNSGSWWWTGRPGVLRFMGLQSQAWLSDWTELMCLNLDFSDGSVIQDLPDNSGDTGLIPGSGRSPEEGNGSTFQCPCLGNPMDRGAWRAIVRGVAKSWTGLSD